MARRVGGRKAPGLGVEVEVRFNRITEIVDRIPDATEALIRRAVENTAARWAGAVPVDTGTLKNSITAEVVRGGGRDASGRFLGGTGKDIIGTVYTNVHYAPYVEYGTRYMAARPAARPAFAVESANLLRAISALGSSL